MVPLFFFFALKAIFDEFLICVGTKISFCLHISDSPRNANEDYYKIKSLERFKEKTKNQEMYKQETFTGRKQGGKRRKKGGKRFQQNKGKQS